MSVATIPEAIRGVGEFHELFLDLGDLEPAFEAICDLVTTQGEIALASSEDDLRKITSSPVHNDELVRNLATHNSAMVAKALYYSRARDKMIMAFSGLLLSDGIPHHYLVEPHVVAIRYHDRMGGASEAKKGLWQLAQLVRLGEKFIAAFERETGFTAHRAEFLAELREFYSTFKEQLDTRRESLARTYTA